MLFYKKAKIQLSEWLVLSGLIRLKNSLTGRRHIILTFHRIRPEGQASDPFDTCPSVSVGMFYEIISYIKNHYNIVTLRSLSENRSLKYPLAAITFDDGWRDNYMYAFPILKELHVPATIFVSTGKIGSSEPFWQQKLGKFFGIVNQQGGERIRESLLRIIGMNSIVTLDSKSYRMVVNHWKSFNHREIERRLISDDWPKETFIWEKFNFVKADEITEMSHHNIEFGSHTVNHVILTKSSRELVNSELTESKERLENITGQPIVMISYPDGAVSEKVIQTAREIGYKIGCTTKRSLVRTEDDMLRLPRIETDWDLLEKGHGRLNEFRFKWSTR